VRVVKFGQLPRITLKKVYSTHIAIAVQKKRTFRRLWIVRINAGARLNGTTYSRLMHALKLKNIQINRKVLADLAANQPSIFKRIVRSAIG